ncbi:MAG TPA: NTP transferase domain-containing protein [Methanomassiliicoccales archaeon]|nr:NTP transferase domain-containing protein [Methanomassiliicoccales archaeon]
MPRVSAVVTAGGKGTRIAELRQEKPLVTLSDRPMIDYVLEALRGSKEVSEIVVSVSQATPETEKHVRALGYRFVRTPGAGYVEDLRYAMYLITTPYVLVVPADMPLLRSESIDKVVTAFYRSKKSSIVVGVPEALFQEANLGADPTVVMDMNGERAVPCGISIVDRDLMLKGEYLDEAYMVTELADFAINVNTVAQLRKAEGVIRSRGV